MWILSGATLNNYIALPDNIALNPEKLLNKLIDTTTDVFFNLPSVLAADLWGNAFFYQFEQSSESASGKSMLRPLPLVAKNRPKGKVAHGDDLGFLFNICDVFGKRINGSELKSQEDKQTRKKFVELLTNFAYLSESKKEFSVGGAILKPFRADETNYIKISNKMKLEKDFRFCELSLWGAPLKSAQKITCDFSKTLTSQITKVGDAAGDVVKSINPLNKIG